MEGALRLLRTAGSRGSTARGRASAFAQKYEASRTVHPRRGDGWTGEPSAWAQPDSVPQRLSTLAQTRLAGAKQWVADVAGDFDAAAIDARLDADIGSAGVVLFSFTSCPFCKVLWLSGLEPQTSERVTPAAAHACRLTLAHKSSPRRRSTPRVSRTMR